MYQYAYLHGFSSGPASMKGVRLARAFDRKGVTIELPDLNVPSFADLSPKGMLGALDALDKAGPPWATWRFIGSSMGGWLAAMWAQQHPDRVDRLVLLCPGFGIQDRWANIVGQAGFEQWQRDGRIPIPDARGIPVPLHYRLVMEMEDLPRFPEVPCATLIIHGTQDVTVPIDGSRRYVAARSHVRLVEVDDNHTLLNSLDRIGKETARFFGI